MTFHELPVAPYPDDPVPPAPAVVDEVEAIDEEEAKPKRRRPEPPEPCAHPSCDVLAPRGGSWCPTHFLAYCPSCPHVPGPYRPTNPCPKHAYLYVPGTGQTWAGRARMALAAYRAAVTTGVPVALDPVSLEALDRAGVRPHEANLAPYSPPDQRAIALARTRGLDLDAEDPDKEEEDQAGWSDARKAAAIAEHREAMRRLKVAEAREAAAKARRIADAKARAKAKRAQQ